LLALASFSDAAPPKETLAGSVERVTFHNEDNGFGVLKVKARGKRNLLPVVGHVSSISAQTAERAKRRAVRAQRQLIRLSQARWCGRRDNFERRAVSRRAAAMDLDAAPLKCELMP
jgi:hypothetical protein